jgi:hypothetical protein
MNAVNALKTAVKGVLSLASRNLKAIATQLQKAGLVLLITTQVRCSRVRTLVLLLLPVVEDSYAPREFLQRCDVTASQWNNRCELAAAVSNLLDAPRRSRASRQQKKLAQGVKSEPVEDDFSSGDVCDPFSTQTTAFLSFTGVRCSTDAKCEKRSRGHSSSSGTGPHVSRCRRYEGMEKCNGALSNGVLCCHRLRVW